MGRRQYLIISGVFFAAIALMHWCRVFSGWPIQMGSWLVPISISWIGGPVMTVLAIWAFRLASKAR
ncbi:MAG: hypothetical protein KOO62_11650 [candidate division Zixibacteria bacterium]|nr:hypothetical protein [candidate division Zixibacteria bacterium]